MGGDGARTDVGLGSPTVLIVDDDRELADLYAARLGEEYEVLTAYGGEEAIETFRRERHAIDAVLLDRRMPDLHGDMVLVSIRDAGFDCPVALVTGVAPDFDVLGRGFDDCVRKPVGREALLATVEGLLERDSYDALVRELSAKRVRRNVLRAERRAAELESSERFAELERDIERLERRLERVRGRVEAGRSRSTAPVARPQRPQAPPPA